MPRQSKGARLWLQPEHRAKDGSVRMRAVWVIRDGPRKVSTGCTAEDRAGAEQALSAYIADKYKPQRDRNRDPSEILIADVLCIYLTDVASGHAREQETRQRAMTLDGWWGDKRLSDVTGRACRDYVAWRMAQDWKASRPESTGNPARKVSSAAARRELEDLRAAINHHRREGLCSEQVLVVLPEKPVARERWLTRGEAARLILAAWRYRETQKGRETGRRSRRHVARYILIGLYTGTRSAAICGAGFEPEPGRGWIDLDAGVFYRRAIGRRATKKRQPPVKLPSRLLAHLRRWKRLGVSVSSPVEWNGRPVGSVSKAFGRSVADAGLGADVTPHVLRHTCATWLMQAGEDIWATAGYLGMTVQQLEATYGHHHPDFQAAVAESSRRHNADRNARNEREQNRTNVIEISRKSMI